MLIFLLIPLLSELQYRNFAVKITLKTSVVRPNTEESQFFPVVIILISLVAILISFWRWLFLFLRLENTNIPVIPLLLELQYRYFAVKITLKTSVVRPNTEDS
jgi:hypothetical protein